MKWLAMWVLVVAGCGDGGPAPADMTMQVQPDMTVPLTDQQVCDMSCAKLIACGVGYQQAACAAGCMQTAVYRNCARTVIDDCNALALCNFKQYANDFCNGSGGVPAGAGTCKTASSCEATCTPGSAACPCACIAPMASTKALKLLINNVCAVSKCAVQCSPPSSAATCDTCAAQMCATEQAQCASN